MKYRICVACFLLLFFCTACAPISTRLSTSDADSVPDYTPTISVAYNIGDTFSVNGFEVTVDGFDFMDKIATSAYYSFSPDVGNIYAVVSLTVTNKGKSLDTFLPSCPIRDDIRARILFGDEYEFSPVNLLGYDSDLHNCNLNPLSSKSGQIVFEISNTVSTSSDPLVFSLDGSDTVTVNLR